MDWYYFNYLKKYLIFNVKNINIIKIALSYIAIIEIRSYRVIAAARIDYIKQALIFF